MNCVNRSSLGVGAGAGARPSLEVAFELADKETRVSQFVLEELELIKQVDLLDSSLVRLWIMF